MQADRMNLRVTIYHQGGEAIMAQGVLSFQYEEEKLESGATSLSGLPVYLDFAHVAGLRESIRRHVRVREGTQGWTDEQLIVSLIQTRKIEKTATLDMDATLVETSKAGALHSYKHYKAYQPLNVWWAERGMVLHTEFRDGN